MSEKVASIIFLGFMVLVPIGMIIGIIILIIRKLSKSESLKKAAFRYNWNEIKPESSEFKEVHNKMENSIFSMRKGQHKLKNVFSGAMGSNSFVLADYHFRTNTAYHKTRMATDYSILMIKDKIKVPDMWIIYKVSGLIALIAKKLIECEIIEPSDPLWNWAWISSENVLKEMNFDLEVSKTLKGLLKPGETIFLSSGNIILVKQGEMNSEWFTKVDSIINDIDRIF